MQSRLSSFIEANLNTFTGFLLSWFVMHWVIRPIWGMDISSDDSFMITTIFTIVSIARNYFIRRYANWLDHHPKGKAFVQTLKFKILKVFQ